MMIRAAAGEGVVLDGDGRPFHDALARPATPGGGRRAPRGGRAAARPARRSASSLLAPGVPLALDAGGFDRHTFLCGQSGSGKTYALGAVLERLLHATALRIVVLDPNSDFVRLGGDPRRTRTRRRPRATREVAPRDRRAAEPATGLAAARSPSSTAADAGGRAPPRSRRRPRGVRGRSSRSSSAAAPRHARRARPDEQLSLRIKNLGADKLGRSGRAARTDSIVADVARRRRALPRRRPRLAADARGAGARVATAVLDALWRERERRQPVLVVIDEAHNVCPAEPDGRADGALDRAGDPHRRRGAQVRALPARLDAAAAEGARERALPVRQPAAHAHELAGRPRATWARCSRSSRRACSRARPRSARASASSPGRSRRIPRSCAIGARIRREGGGDVPATWADALELGPLAGIEDAHLDVRASARRPRGRTPRPARGSRGGPRPIGANVPQWIGIAIRGRRRRTASAARSGSRWRPLSTLAAPAPHRDERDVEVRHEPVHARRTGPCRPRSRSAPSRGARSRPR